MAISLQSGTPLAEALSSSVQPKLVEMGWSVDGEDSSPLSEYIVLMLVNGKTEDQINSELSGDLLGLGSEDESTKVFTRWLFDELKRLAEQHGVASSAPSQNDSNLMVRSEVNGLPNQGDDEMQDASGQSSEAIPTGPRAMRHGGNNANTSTNNSNNNNNNQQHNQQHGRRPGGMFNQMNKAMERSPNDTLRHVRNQGNSPRITKYDRNGRPIMGGNSGMNQHNRNMQNQRMHQHVQSAFGMPPQMGGPQQQQQQQMQNQNMAAAAAAAGGAFNPLMMSPEQQMQFFQMMEQQARMLGMPGFMPGMMGGQQGFPNGQGGGQFGQNGGQGQGRSMFERVQMSANRQHKNKNDSAAQSESADTMDAESKTDDGGEETSKDQVACKFALSCTKVECPFAHPSPVSEPSRATSFVPGEKCEFGVNCKNRKCTQSHPSPAGAPNAPAAGAAPKINAAAQLDCKYYPNCTNPVCPYKHPMPPCRNGPSCTRPGCHFSHEPLDIPCRFHPCLNVSCVYKHEEGQQGNFDHKVWTADGKAKPHVSERKFVSDDSGHGEELIIPGKESSQGNGDQDLLNVEHDMHDL